MVEPGYRFVVGAVGGADVRGHRDRPPLQFRFMAAGPSRDAAAGAPATCIKPAIRLPRPCRSHSGRAAVRAPVWLVFAGSTQDSDAIMRGELSLLPHLSNLSVYQRILTAGAMGTQPVWRMLLISLGMALAIAIGKIVISVLSAFAVAFFRFPFRKIAFWLIFITLMLPVEVRIIPTYSVMADFGLINTFTGLWLPLIASATATLLFRQVFIAIPDELVEAARMDGAGPLRFLWDIVLPVSGANIAALFVILFVYGWNQYLWPLLVATNPRPRHHRHRHRQNDRRSKRRPTGAR